MHEHTHTHTNNTAVLMVWSAPEHANDIHYANAYKSEPTIWESKLGKTTKNKIKWGGGEWRGAVFGWGGYKSKTERGGESGESTVRSTKNRQYKLLH